MSDGAWRALVARTADGQGDPGRTFHLDLGAQPTEVRHARTFLRSRLSGYPQLPLDLVLLLASELVTNAMLHGRSRIALDTCVFAGAIPAQGAAPPGSRADRAGRRHRRVAERAPPAAAFTLPGRRARAADRPRTGRRVGLASAGGRPRQDRLVSGADRVGEKARAPQAQTCPKRGGRDGLARGLQGGPAPSGELRGTPAASRSAIASITSWRATVRSSSHQLPVVMSVPATA